MFEITLQGPGKNALGTETMTFLVNQLREAAGRPVLLTGSGDAFSAGLNLREVAQLDAATMPAFLQLLEDCMTALYLYPGPTVACVNGHAIAGGAVLTLCCDRRVIAASPKIKIGLNEVALGVRFPPRTLAIVASRVPRQHHEEVILGAGLHGPDDALRLGLVDEIAADALGVARARLDALGSHPAEAYATTKRDLRGTEVDLCASDVQAQRIAEAVAFWTAPALKEKIAALFAR